MLWSKKVSVNGRECQWQKVSRLKPGMKIAVKNNGRVEFEEIAAIKPLGRKHVYDIEVEGSHNFVANAIIAHNTYISGNLAVDQGAKNGVCLGEDGLVVCRPAASEMSDWYWVREPSPGKIVAIGPEAGVLAMADQAYQPAMIGVVSEIGDDQLEGSVRATVVMAGKASVKIAPDSAPIQPGDYLTSSATYPGMAMKATGSGYALGKALETWEPAANDVTPPRSPSEHLGGVTISVLVGPGWQAGVEYLADADTVAEESTASAGLDTDSSASLAELLAMISNIEANSVANDLNMTNFEAETATISGDLQVLGKTTTAELGVLGQIRAGLLVIDGLTETGATISTLAGPLKLQEMALADLEIMGGKVTVDTQGNLIVKGTIKAKEVETEKLRIIGNQTAGTATILRSATTVEVTTSASQPTSRILLTATTLTDKTLVVTKKEAGKFTVEIKTSAEEDIKFDWLIIEN